MSQVDRRTVAKGALWATPVLSVAAAAPSMAASPCSTFIKGQPLPASAFVPGYVIVTNQTFGGAANKAISLAAGISLSAAAVQCIGPAALSFSLNTASGGTMTLTNGTTYTVSGGTGSTGTGTAGTTGNCSGPAGATGQVCNTYISVGLANSSGTSSANPRSAHLNYQITVAGYGTTNVVLNATSFSQDGTNWDGAGVTFS